MSRSRKSAPYTGHTSAGTDKPWKQQHARRARRAVHQTLDQTADGDAVPSNRYAFGAADWHGMKDGKQRIDDPTSWLRK